MDGPMGGVDPDIVEQDVGNFWRNLYKLEKGFNDVPAPKKICSKVCYVYLASSFVKNTALANAIFLSCGERTLLCDAHAISNTRFR